jgi:hypothetical protein
MKILAMLVFPKFNPLTVPGKALFVDLGKMSKFILLLRLSGIEFSLVPD